MALDVFEVVMLVGACFLVNYITADSKTNWAEGYTLISFYLIIVSAPWSNRIYLPITDNLPGTSGLVL